MNIQKNTNDAVGYNVIRQKMEDIIEETKETEEAEINAVCLLPPLHPLPPIHIPPLHIPPIETSHSFSSLYGDSKTKNIILPTITKRPKTCSVNIQNNNHDNIYDNNHDNNHDNIYNNNHDNNHKKKEKRVVTQKKQWMFSDFDFTQSKQIELLKQIISPLKITSISHVSNLHTPESIKEKCLSQEISKKLYGYKSQDQAKNIWDENKFISFETCIDLLIRCNLTCFYCKKSVLVLYESVRDPIQWSLERIDNTYGHNYDNVEIACLKCNVSRRTMYHERYLFTKQLNIIKTDV